MMCVQEFSSIPELSINPLHQRLGQIFSEVNFKVRPVEAWRSPQTCRFRFASLSGQGVPQGQACLLVGRVNSRRLSLPAGFKLSFSPPHRPGMNRCCPRKWGSCTESCASLRLPDLRL